MSGDVTKPSFVCKGGASDSEEIQVVLRRRAPLVIGAVTALCLSAAACTPSGPTTPSPTPTSYASPTETKLERQTRLDFEAAEKAYRTFSTEVDRIANAGGAKQPTQVMKDNAAGPQLKASSTYLRQLHDLGARARGRIVIAYVHHGGYDPSRLTLESCEDGSNFSVYDRNGKLMSRSDSATTTLDVRRIDGRWKVWETKTQTVMTCPT